MRIHGLTIYSLMSLGLIVAGQSAATGQTYEAVNVTGASSNRVDMIFIGDGYTAAQLTTVYGTHIAGTVNHFFNNPLSSPFGRYQNFFNIHRVNIASNQSGADDPNNNIYVDTALDATYNVGGTDRCLYFNTTKANAAVATALSGTGIDVDMRLGVVNSTKYGGCGGQWAVWAGGNSVANEIAVHEIGHSFANLADEYFYDGLTYSGSEPGEWNATTSPATGKWDRWLGYVDPTNDIGAIGYYEGGRYYDFGIYRPSANSKMRALNRPFDAISREKIIYEIYNEVDPLDNWYDNSATLNNAASLWVDAVDPSVIEIEWFVDGLSTGVYGENLDIAALNLVDGSYTISAFAHDRILDHAFSGDSLDWWRLAPDLLQQTISWDLVLVTIPEPGSLSLGLAFCGALAFGRRRRTNGSPTN